MASSHAAPELRLTMGTVASIPLVLEMTERAFGALTSLPSIRTEGSTPNRVRRAFNMPAY